MCALLSKSINKEKKRKFKSKAGNNSQNHKKRDLSKVQCFWYKKSGHIRRYCPNKQDHQDTLAEAHELENPLFYVALSSEWTQVIIIG